VKSLAPDLLQLFNTLVDAKRSADDVETEEIKALSLCTLLHTRSRRANGF